MTSRPVDLRTLLGAVARGDAEGVRAELREGEIGDLLQLAGDGVHVVLDAGLDGGEELARTVIEGLRERDGLGDDVLAEDLESRLTGVAIAARRVAVNLDEVAYLLEGDPLEPGGFLDLHTGEVLPSFLTDPAEAGEDGYVDVEEEPDRWLPLERLGSRDGWRDMAAFAARQDDPLRELLEVAISGPGAFRRFRDVVDRHDLVDEWRAYADDRTTGRARAYLAEEGVRARPH